MSRGECQSEGTPAHPHRRPHLRAAIQPAGFRWKRLSVKCFFKWELSARALVFLE
jgi:hypothetical protein